MSSVLQIGGYRIVGYTTSIRIEMNFDGGCRSPSVAGAGCEIVISKGKRMLPVEEDMEDRIHIRDYPMGGGHTSNKMEYRGLEIGLAVVLEHVKSSYLKG